MAVLATAAVAQAPVDAPTAHEGDHYITEVDRPYGTRFQLTTRYSEGPHEPAENPYYITEPLTLEGRGTQVTTSLASSQGAVAAGSQAVTGDVMGPGAIMSAGRGAGQASSSQQDARRSLKKLIKQLG
jgi:hypothetical protein